MFLHKKGIEQIYIINMTDGEGDSYVPPNICVSGVGCGFKNRINFVFIRIIKAPNA